MNYKKHFAEALKINQKAIVGFIPKDGNNTNFAISNMMIIIDPEFMT
jgi:hypothetical protein